MTSEVIVMNRWGVALAADSAVTIKKTGDTPKSRDTGLKLFTLSKYHPVGVMVYNNVSLLGVPWETIIKLFRQSLGDKSFETLEEYGHELIRYIEDCQDMWPTEVQQKYYIQNLTYVYRRIDKTADEKLSDTIRNKIPTDEVLRDRQTQIAEAIQLELQLLKEKDDCFDYNASKKFVGKLSGDVHALKSDIFKSWGLNNESVGHLWEIAILLISKNVFSTASYTGVVISGFGEKEHFPSVQDFMIGGIYENKLKYLPPHCEKITENNSSIIKAFAYTDMVYSFINGYTMRVSTLLEKAIELIQEMPVEAIDIIDDLSPEQRDSWKQKIGVNSKDLAQWFSDLVTQALIDRQHNIRQEIENLPHKELAQVASTLVNLNSFQQRMSPELETVGGPIDVAVISKGDGLSGLSENTIFVKI